MKNFLNIIAIIFILGLVYIPVFGVGLSQGSAASNQSLVKFFKDNQNTNISSSFSAPKILDSDLNINEDILVNYKKELVNVWSKSSFSEEDFKKLKKDKNSRPFSVDELARQAEIMGITDEMYYSLRAWSEFDERILKELKAMPINKKQSDLHRNMIRWYKYHANFASKLANKSISREEIKSINTDYLKNEKYHLPSLHRKLAGSEGDSNNQFVLWKYVINNAQAVGGAPQFGGLITSYSEVCITGFSFIVTGTQGGWMWIYYASMTIAGGARMNYVIVPGGYIKGKSLLVPGLCTRIGIDAHPSGVATVLYYGSSL